MATMQLTLSDVRKGSLVATLSALCYASAVIFIRRAYAAGILPGMAVFLRFTIAAVALTAFLRLSGRWRPLPKRQVIALFLLGFLAYTLLGVTWFEALNVAPAWLVSLMIALYPLAINLGSWVFLKQGLTRFQTMALAAVLVGGILLFWRPLEIMAWRGVLLMLANVLIQTGYVLVGQHYTRGVPPAMSAVWMIIGAALGTAIYAAASGQVSLGFAPEGWIWTSLFAVISTALAIMTLWWAIGLLGPGRAAIIGSCEPLFSIVLAVLFLGEQMTSLQVAGGTLILMGMFLAQL